MYYHQVYKEKAAAAARKFRAENPQRRRDIDLKSKYGIDLMGYKTMLESQNGLCAGCGGEPTRDGKLFVDHDHLAGRVRGLLCHHCNVILGYAKDNPVVLEKLSKYLKGK